MGTCPSTKEEPPINDVMDLFRQQIPYLPQRLAEGTENKETKAFEKKYIISQIIDCKSKLWPVPWLYCEVISWRLANINDLIGLFVATKQNLLFHRPGKGTTRTNKKLPKSMRKTQKGQEKGTLHEHNFLLLLPASQKTFHPASTFIIAQQTPATFLSVPFFLLFWSGLSRCPFSKGICLFSVSTFEYLTARISFSVFSLFPRNKTWS